MTEEWRPVVVVALIIMFAFDIALLGIMLQLDQIARAAESNHKTSDDSLDSLRDVTHQLERIAVVLEQQEDSR